MSKVADFQVAIDAENGMMADARLTTMVVTIITRKRGGSG